MQFMQKNERNSRQELCKTQNDVNLSQWINRSTRSMDNFDNELCALLVQKNCTDWLSLFKKKGHVRYCNHPCKYIMCIASVSGHRVSIWRIGLRYSVTPTLISTRASTGACDHLIARWTELWFVILYSLLNMTATRTDDRFISPSVKM